MREKESGSFSPGFLLQRWGWEGRHWGAGKPLSPAPFLQAHGEVALGGRSLAGPRGDRAPGCPSAELSAEAAAPRV